MEINSFLNISAQPDSPTRVPPLPSGVGSGPEEQQSKEPPAQELRAKALLAPSLGHQLHKQSKSTSENIYLIMNKPLNYVCSSVSDSHKTVYQLLSPELQKLVTEPKRGHRLHTIGRLDSETTGLLLFTTDGNFSHFITAPENKIPKTYKVVLQEKVSPDNQKIYIEKSKSGLILPPEKKSPEEKSEPAEISFIEENKCLIKIHQGKFHQVRRSFLALGNLVTELTRLSIGKLNLPEDLQPGKYKNLTFEEIYSFFS